MSKVNLIGSDSFSAQWQYYKKECITAAVMDAELPINKSDPFHYNRLITSFKLGYEEFVNFVSDASSHARNLNKVNFLAYRERVANKLGFVPASLSDLYK